MAKAFIGVWVLLLGMGSVAAAAGNSLPLASDIASIQISLFNAVKSSNIEGVKAALANGANINANEEPSDTSEWRMTPLHLAVAAQIPKREIIELLLEKGANVNARDGIGWTPLHWAAQNDWPAIVKLLIAKGADVNARSKKGETPLQVTGSREIADLLREHGAK